MKLKIEKNFTDKYDNSIKYVAGKIEEFAIERAEELLKDPRGLVSKVKEATEDEVPLEPSADEGLEENQAEEATNDVEEAAKEEAEKMENENQEVLEKIKEAENELEKADKEPTDVEKPEKSVKKNKKSK